jgi:SAM-dependent methyltransferase
VPEDPPLTGEHADPAAIEARRTAFGEVASAYDRVRAPWPDATVDWLIGSPPAGQSRLVIDIGAGTGKATRTLAGLGHQVVAVDPSDGMLAALRRSLADLPAEVAARVEVVACPAEELTLPDGSADAVLVAQAWHWFDTTRAGAQCARVLRPGGWLGLGWHVWGEDTGPDGWLEELAEIVGNPEVAAGPGAEPPPSLRGGLPDAFGPLERRLFAFEHVLRPDELVLLASSWSYVQIHPRREAVLAAVGRLAQRVARQTTGYADPVLVLPQVSDCYRARRLP